MRQGGAGEVGGVPIGAGQGGEEAYVSFSLLSSLIGEILYEKTLKFIHVNVNNITSQKMTSCMMKMFTHVFIITLQVKSLIKISHTKMYFYCAE